MSRYQFIKLESENKKNLNTAIHEKNYQTPNFEVLLDSRGNPIKKSNQRKVFHQSECEIRVQSI